VTDPSRPEPEARHRRCWYGGRTPAVLPEVSYQTVEDGELLYCSHPMMFPLVRYRFDVRNCDGCDWFKPRKGTTPGAHVLKVTRG
jgi:hypothetical protein